MSSRLRGVLVAVVMTAALVGCSISVPADPDGTLRSVIGGELRVGVSADEGLVAFVVGNSQAMRTAWIDDMLSLIPQIAFLIALIFVRRPTVRHHYGMHRSMGVGFGLWWLDGVAALFISLGITWDGVRNTKSAVIDLMDQRARSYDDKDPHPLAREIVEHLRAQRWISDAAMRMRDQGQVLHVEAFVVPHRCRVPVARIDEISASIAAMDWKVQDVVIVVCSVLPDEADTGEPRAVDAARSDGG